MSVLSHLQAGDLAQLQRALRGALQGVKSLEDAAQITSSLFYDSFFSSLVLVRVFATLPFESLPPALQEAARAPGLALGAPGLGPRSPVLTLLGTRGFLPDWNDRHRSQQHRALPLVSRRSVEEVPMFARFLGELGLDLDWFNEEELQLRALMAQAGLVRHFFLDDAAQAQDARGRLILDEDFARDYAIKTVFGFGGSYIGNGCFLFCVLFSRDALPASVAPHLAMLLNTLKANTLRAVSGRRYFSAR